MQTPDAARHLALLLLAVGLAVGLVGCDDLAGDTDTDSDTDADTGQTTAWDVPGAHPCVEYRVNTLWVEDGGQTLFVGCGEGTTGFGLFASTDGGRAWAQPTTSPTDYFDTFRVNSVHRSSDGLLYVAGTQSPGGHMVVAVDTDASPMTVTTVLERGTTVSTSFSVGSFRRNSQGAAIAESLTGTDLMARASDGDTFEPVNPMSTAGNNVQILDLALHDDAFYGSGSTIAEPHRVLLPPETPTGDFRFQPVDFATSGTLWGIAADADGVAAAGVEEDEDYGIVYLSGADLYDASQWTEVDARDTVGSESTRFYGVCRRGPVIVAVGDYSRTSDALALYSGDGGVSWSEISPEVNGEPAGILGRCHVLEDARVAIAGGGGFYGTFDPTL